MAVEAQAKGIGEGDQVPSGPALVFITAGAFGKTCGRAIRDALRDRWLKDVGIEERFISYFIDHDDQDLLEMSRYGFERIELPYSGRLERENVITRLKEYRLLSNVENGIAHLIRRGHVRQNPRAVRLLLESQEHEIKRLLNGTLSRLRGGAVERVLFVVAFCPAAPTGSAVALFLGKRFPQWTKEWQGYENENGEKVEPVIPGGVFCRTVALQVIPESPNYAEGSQANAMVGHFSRFTLNRWMAQPLGQRPYDTVITFSALDYHGTDHPVLPERALTDLLTPYFAENAAILLRGTELPQARQQGGRLFDYEEALEEMHPVSKCSFVEVDYPEVDELRVLQEALDNDKLWRSNYAEVRAALCSPWQANPPNESDLGPLDDWQSFDESVPPQETVSRKRVNWWLSIGTGAAVVILLIVLGYIFPNVPLVSRFEPQGLGQDVYRALFLILLGWGIPFASASLGQELYHWWLYTQSRKEQEGEQRKLEEEKWRQKEQIVGRVRMLLEFAVRGLLRHMAIASGVGPLIRPRLGEEEAARLLKDSISDVFGEPARTFVRRYAQNELYARVTLPLSNVVPFTFFPSRGNRAWTDIFQGGMLAEAWGQHLSRFPRGSEWESLQRARWVVVHGPDRPGVHWKDQYTNSIRGLDATGVAQYGAFAEEFPEYAEMLAAATPEPSSASEPSQEPEQPSQEVQGNKPPAGQEG